MASKPKTTSTGVEPVSGSLGLKDQLKKVASAVKAAPFEFHCFQRPNLVFGFKDQKLTTRELSPFEERRVSKRDATVYTMRLGSLEVTLPVGLIVISGKTKARKSEFIRLLPSTTIFPAAEPYDGEDEVAGTYAYRDADSALAAGVQAVLSGKAELIAIDSLRAPLFETSGAAGERGIIMPFFTALTRVSNSLATAGITAFASVNPMDESDEYQKAFFNKLVGSTAATILLDKNESSALTGTYEVRARGTAEHRKPRQFRIPLVEETTAIKAEAFDVEIRPATPILDSTFFTTVMLDKLQEQ